jgi:chemotaxis protein MotB
MSGQRSKSHAEEAGHGNHERWLLTYADLITLLMVFFVVMYSISRADIAKFAQLQDSLKRAFRVDVLRGDNPTSLHGDYGTDTIMSPIQEAVILPGSDERLVATLTALRQAVAQLPENERANVLVGMTREGVAISLSGNVLFDSGRADLRPRGIFLLDTLADQFRLLPNDIRVEGHTDNVPLVSDRFPSNWELSAARATMVVRYLAEERGISFQRLSAVAYGDTRPVAPNDTREGRARNRRVDLVILNSSPAPASLERTPTPGGVSR